MPLISLQRFHSRHLALGAFYCTLLLAPQLFGGIFAWSITLLCGLSALTAWLTWWSTRNAERTLASGGGVIAMFALLLWTAVQAVPLPCAWLKLVAPLSTTEYLYTRKLLNLATGSVCTLSLSPGATSIEVIKGAAMLSMFCSAWILAATGNRRHVLQAAALSSIAMALTALAHALFGMHRVFGVYTPLYATPRILAPLMNENHLASLMSLGAPLTLGCAMQHRGLAQRLLWLLGYLLLASVTFLTLSRGGMTSFALGTLLVGLLIYLNRNSQGQRRMALGMTGVALALGTATALYLSAEQLPKEWQQSKVNKLAVSARASTVALEQPFIGIGRGAFSQAYVRYAPSGTRDEFPENILVQLSSEWGIPVALILCLIIGSALVGVYKHSGNGIRSLLRLSAAVAALTLILHNLVDFSLEMLGVSLVFSGVLGGALAPHSNSHPSTSRFSSVHMATWLQWSAIISSLATLIAIAYANSWDRRVNEQKLLELHQHGSINAFNTALRHALLLYPAEPTFTLLAGHAALKHHKPNAIRWLNRTMQLAPNWPEPHALAAHWLYRAHYTDQALLEIRQTATREPAAAFPLACNIAQTSQNPEHMLRAAPRRPPNRIVFLDRVAPCFKPEFQAVIDNTILKEDPNHVPSMVRKAAYLLQGNTQQAYAAVKLLENAINQSPSEPFAHMTLAQAWLALDKPDKALIATRDAEIFVQDLDAILRVRVKAQAAMGDSEAMRETLRQLRGRQSDNAEALAETWFFTGEMEQQLHNHGHALRAYERAYQYIPTEHRYLAAMARVFEDMGNLQRALQIYQELTLKKSAYQSEVARLRLRLHVQ